MWKKVAAVGASLLVTANLVAPTAQATDPLAPPIAWEECPEQVTDPTARCGRIDVPMEYSDPTGPTISVGFVHQPATSPQAKRGTLFGNPGGPGGDGYSYFASDEIFSWPAAINQEWDRVVVQPRGLIGSTPPDCSEPPPHFEGNPILHNGGYLKAGCDFKNPGLTDSLTTSNTAEDWEMVRRALGLETISIIGLSYGTYLGSVYATRYPDRVDHLVLDSAMDPAIGWAQLIAEQDAGFEAAFHELLAYAAINNDVYHLGDTPLKVYQSWTNRVLQETGTNSTLLPPPAQIGDVPAGLEWAGDSVIQVINTLAQPKVEVDGVITRAMNPGASQGESTTAILTMQSLPRPESWHDWALHVNGSQPHPALAAANEMEDLQEHEVEALVNQLINVQAMQRMVICNENTSSPDYRWLPELAWSTLTGHPLIQSASYGSGLACSGISPQRRLEHMDGAGLKHRPLQISGLRDPQTPYSGHRTIADAMNAHVVTVHGAGHGHFGLGNKLVDDLVVNYLRTGETPAVTDLPGLLEQR